MSLANPLWGAPRIHGELLKLVSLIRFEQVAKIPLAEHNYIVQAIPPNRADQPFGISVLPW